MKSQVNALLHVVQGLHKDVLAAYPALKEELSRDYERLALYCQHRGLGLFTLDLPHLESLLLKGLDCGRLMLEGPLSCRVSKRIQVPRLYSGLWLRVFDRDASLKQDVDVTALFFLRQLLVIGKKIEVECSYDRQQATVGAYHDIERSLRTPSLNWDSDILDVDNRLRSCHLVQAFDGSLNSISKTLPLFSQEKGDENKEKEERESRLLLVKVQQVADLIIGSFDHLDPLFISDWWYLNGQGSGFRHGPGAVSERLRNWEKSRFPNWPEKLQGTFPFEKCGTYSGSLVDRPLNHEVASRLIMVPKTAKGPRLIAAEPVAHQYCQQLLLRFLFEQCRTHFGTSFIDFQDQSKSGDMVLEASLNQSLATVDLSDASDRLSCWTVERIFRSNPSILNALHAARTRYIRDDISEYPSFLKTKKFASQGTATTFPVMSLVMLCIALGASLEEDVTWHSIWKLRAQVRIFGDDIIMPKSGYERLIRIMDSLQLKVNVAKSYNNGSFRESCGVDGFRGYDVTPLKPKTLVADGPASRQAVVDITNNLYLKGMWHASTACFSLLPARLRRGIRIVGVNDAGFRGLTSYSGSDESHLVSRWNSRLHRYEVRVWSLSDRLEKRPRDGPHTLLDWFASKHNHEHARIVSEYVSVRKTRDGLLWEPLNTDARVPSWVQKQLTAIRNCG